MVLFDHIGCGKADASACDPQRHATIEACAADVLDILRAEASFCASDPCIARRFALATFMGDNRADLPKVSVPSLVIQCAEDAIAPMVVGRYVHTHTPGSTLAVIDASGHCPHMTHPDETIALIKDYLASRTSP